MKDDNSLVKILATTILIVTAGAYGLSHLSEHAWLGELTVHFPMHLTGIALFLSGLFLVTWAWRRALASCILATACLVSVLQPIPVGLSKTVAAEDGGITVISFNTQFDNPDHYRIIEFLETAEAGIVLLSEVSPRLGEKLRDLEAPYPHLAKNVLSPSGTGMVLLSRHEIVESRFADPIGRNLPYLVAKVRIDGRDLTIVGVHPHSPVSPGAVRFRNEYLQAVAAEISKISEPVVLLGDMNITPWSPRFQSFLTASRLEQSLWPEATWPSGLRGFGVPIDHILARGVFLSSLASGPDAGSDHLPVSAKIRFIDSDRNHSRSSMEDTEE